MLSCTVLLLLGTRPAIVEHLGERDHLALGTNVMVRRFNIFEARWPALVGAMRGNETFKVPLFQHRVIFPATVARVGHAVLPYQPLLPQASF